MRPTDCRQDLTLAQVCELLALKLAERTQAQLTLNQQVRGSSPLRVTTDLVRGLKT